MAVKWLSQRGREVLTCAVICLVSALLSFAFFMVQEGGTLSLADDFSVQQIPFTMALHNQVSRGGLAGWCWNLNLGTSAIQGFGFYELGSPFFWVSMVFPASWFPYVVGWMYIAKYVVAGITSFLYVRRFVSDARSATIAALLYAFSGFQATNLLFYHFHDIVAFFPLLLIGLERLMEKKDDFVPFVLSVCINCLVNYFFFVQSCVFLLLYFCFRFAPMLWREGARALFAACLRCLAFGALGVGVASVLFLPSVLYMTENPKAQQPLSSDWLWWGKERLMSILGAFVVPGEPMHDQSAIAPHDYLSCACWLPMVGPSLAIAHVQYKRNWLSRLLVMLVAMSLIPFLDAAFLLFKGLYFRWWYALVLMGALASAVVADEPEKFDIRFGSIVTIVAIVVYYLLVRTGVRPNGASYVIHGSRLLLYCAVSLLGVVCVLMSFRKGKKKDVSVHQHLWVPVGAVALFCAASTFMTLNWYWMGEDGAAQSRQLIELGESLEVLDPAYRYATIENRLNLTGDAAGISSMTSTASPASARFEKMLGGSAISVHHLRRLSLNPGVKELVAGSFVVEPSNADGLSLSELKAGGKAWRVRDDIGCPIAFVCEHFITHSELMRIDAKQRGAALLQASVVQDEDKDLASAYADEVTAGEIALDRSVKELAKEARSNGAEQFSRDDSGFAFKIHANKRELVYMSVPNDRGWSATVDGEQAEILDSGGMMLLPLSEGEHDVRLTYRTPGLVEGAVVSAVSCALLLTGMVWKRRSR